MHLCRLTVRRTLDALGRHSLDCTMNSFNAERSKADFVALLRFILSCHDSPLSWWKRLGSRCRTDVWLTLDTKVSADFDFKVSFRSRLWFRDILSDELVHCPLRERISGRDEKKLMRAFPQRRPRFRNVFSNEHVQCTARTN